MKKGFFSIFLLFVISLFFISIKPSFALCEVDESYPMCMDNEEFNMARCECFPYDPPYEPDQLSWCWRLELEPGGSCSANESYVRYTAVSNCYEADYCGGGGGGPGSGPTCGETEINPANITNLSNDDRFDVRIGPMNVCTNCCPFNFCGLECGGTPDVGPSSTDFRGNICSAGEQFCTCGGNQVNSGCLVNGWDYGSSAETDSNPRHTFCHKDKDTNASCGEPPSECKCEGGWSQPCCDECPDPQGELPSSTVAPNGEIIFKIYTNIPHNTDEQYLGSTRRLHDRIGGAADRKVYMNGPINWGDDYLHDCVFSTETWSNANGSGDKLVYTCKAPQNPGAYTATFSTKKNCDVDFNYTVVAPTPTPTNTPTPSNTPTPTPIPISCSVSGDGLVLVGYPENYRTDGLGAFITRLEAFFSPANIVNGWSPVCSDITSPFSCSSDVTFQCSGTHYVVCNAYDSLGGRCSGSPWAPPATWGDCGPEDLRQVNVACPSVNPIVFCEAYIDRIELRWVAPPYAAGYKVYRAPVRPNGTPGTYVDLGGTTVTNWIDRPPTEGEYYYKVTALYGTENCCESPGAVTICGLPPPPTRPPGEPTYTPIPTFTPIPTRTPTPTVPASSCQVQRVRAGDEEYDDRIDIRYEVRNGSSANGIFVFYNDGGIDQYLAGPLDPPADRVVETYVDQRDDPPLVCSTSYLYRVCCAIDLGGGRYSLVGCNSDPGSTMECVETPTPTTTSTPTPTPTNVPTPTPNPACSETCKVTKFTVDAPASGQMRVSWDGYWSNSVDRTYYRIVTGHHSQTSNPDPATKGPLNYDWFPNITPLLGWYTDFKGSAIENDNPETPGVIDPPPDCLPAPGDPYPDGQPYVFGCFYNPDWSNPATTINCGGYYPPVIGKTYCPPTPTPTSPPTPTPFQFYSCPM